MSLLSQSLPEGRSVAFARFPGMDSSAGPHQSGAPSFNNQDRSAKDKITQTQPPETMKSLNSNLITIALGAAITVMCGNTTQAANPCLLIDMQSSSSFPYTPGTDDVYMIDESVPPSAGAPVQNNYSDGNGWNNDIGQIFTTPNTSANGYILNSVAILTWGNGGRNINTIGESWALRIYTITSSGGTNFATPFVSYACTNQFTFTEQDWIQFTNLGAGLAANATCAYAIQNLGAGWEAIAGENQVDSYDTFASSTTD